MPYNLKDTARLIGGTKVGKRVEKNTIDDIGTGNRNSNDVIDMDYISPGLQGMAPQNEQEIEIEDEFLNNNATKKVPLKIDPIGKTLGTVRNLDGMRTKAVNIGDRYYEFHTGDVHNSRREEEKNWHGKNEFNFLVDGDNENSLGLPSLSGDNIIDLMLYTAVAERGVGEAGGSDNDTKYGEWYYNRRVKDNPERKETYAWCATFVSWAANQVGLVSSNEKVLDNVIPRYQNCSEGQRLYKEDGRLHYVGDKSDNYKPKAGDVFFQSSAKQPEGGAHTGFVLHYDEKNNCIYTVEGNADHKVKVVKRPVSTIFSFGSNGGSENGITPTDIDKTVGGTI